jgi:hypothetical protein
MAYPDAWGLKYEEVVSLTWLAYKGQGTFGTYQFQNGSTWEVTNVFEVGGFRAVLVKGNEKTILSFSGTDMTQAEDWNNNILQGVQGISPYYLYALYYARTNAADVVVGHSLGGGLASYCAVYGGKPAATINPAPLNINLASGIGMLKNGNLVVNYVATGEALELLDIAAPNMTKVGRTIHVGSGSFDPISRHLLGNLSGFSAPVKIR